MKGPSATFDLRQLASVDSTDLERAKLFVERFLGPLQRLVFPPVSLEFLIEFLELVFKSRALSCPILLLSDAVGAGEDNDPPKIIDPSRFGRTPSLGFWGLRHQGALRVSTALFFSNLNLGSRL